MSKIITEDQDFSTKIQIIRLTETATSGVSNSETKNLAMHNSGTNFAQMAS